MAEVDQAAEAESDTVEDKGAEAADQFAAADEAASPEPTAADVAATLGWQPEEAYVEKHGSKEGWKPAADFLRDGRDVQRSMKRTIDSLSTKLDTLTRTSGTLMEEKLREQHQQLAAKFQAAVEKGDPDEAFAAAAGIATLKGKADETTALAPAPETVEWAQRNERVMKDPLATQRAIALCEPYARANYSPSAQLAAIEPILRREFPHLFQQAETPAEVEAVRTRATSQTKRGSTFADMPKEAQEIARDMADRKLINSVDDYARNYFAQVGKGK